MSALRAARLVARDVAPDLVGEPLEALARVCEVARGQRRSVVREVSRELNHLVQELAQRDVPAALP